MNTFIVIFVIALVLLGLVAIYYKSLVAKIKAEEARVQAALVADAAAQKAKLEGAIKADLASVQVQIGRELDRLELLMKQIAQVERERAELLDPERSPETAKAAKLIELNGIGPEFATKLYLEGLYRSFGNRRKVGAYSGLVGSPWSSGQIDHEQGVSKAGNPRLRATLIELAWLWTRHQPDSALTKWFLGRLKGAGGRHKKRLIVALARKLLVALWKYLETGEPIEGARMKSTSPKSAAKTSA